MHDVRGVINRRLEWLKRPKAQWPPSRTEATENWDPADAVLFTGALAGKIAFGWQQGLHSTTNNTSADTKCSGITGAINGEDRVYIFLEADPATYPLGLIDVASALLHEMCHAFVILRICSSSKQCGCNDIAGVGVSGHGWAWQKLAKAVEDFMGGKHMAVSVCLARIVSVEAELEVCDSEETGRMWDEKADMFNRECFDRRVLEELVAESGE